MLSVKPQSPPNKSRLSSSLSQAVAQALATSQDVSKLKESYALSSEQETLLQSLMNPSSSTEIPASDASKQAMTLAKESSPTESPTSVARKPVLTIVPASSEKESSPTESPTSFASKEVATIAPASTSSATKSCPAMPAIDTTTSVVDKSDPNAVLRYDSAGVAINARGDLGMLKQLREFSVSVEHYAKLMQENVDHPAPKPDNGDAYESFPNIGSEDSSTIDPAALLQYDPAGLAIRTKGDEKLLRELVRFASSLTRYVVMVEEREESVERVVVAREEARIAAQEEAKRSQRRKSQTSKDLSRQVRIQNAYRDDDDDELSQRNDCTILANPNNCFLAVKPRLDGCTGGLKLWSQGAKEGAKEFFGDLRNAMRLDMD